MTQFAYIAVLLGCLLGTAWLEFFLRTRVYRRARRLVMTVVPVVVVFAIWDAYAINRGHWYFDKNQILGILGPFEIPLEEFLFFLIVPLAALLTIEAVRTVKKHWVVGDES